MPPVSTCDCIEMLFETLKAKAKSFPGAIQQAEDAERALTAPVERCKAVGEEAKRKEQAEQRENALQKRTEAFAALYELGCATIEAAKSLAAEHFTTHKATSPGTSRAASRFGTSGRRIADC